MKHAYTYTQGVSKEHQWRSKGTPYEDSLCMFAPDFSRFTHIIILYRARKHYFCGVI